MAQDNFLKSVSPSALWGKISSNTRYYLGLEPVKSVEVKPNVSTVSHKCVNCLPDVIKSRFVRLAGVSGAIAVVMGAYGSHVLFPRSDVPNELKEIYRTANYYHFLHTLALLAVPLVRWPVTVGTLLSTGMTVFCGTCYYHALTGNRSLAVFTPFGGILLIFGWLTMFL